MSSGCECGALIILRKTTVDKNRPTIAGGKKERKAPRLIKPHYDRKESPPDFLLVEMTISF